MAFDSMHAASCGKLLKLGFEFFLAFCHDEAYIHVTSICLVCYGATEEGVAINFCIEQFGFLSISATPPCSFIQRKV